MADVEHCRDCLVELNADNVWEPGTCVECIKKLSSEELEALKPARLIVCPDEHNCEPYGEHYRRLQEGRCLRCGNYSKICGHDLPFKDRIKTVNADTGWMPNTGSATQAPFGADHRIGEK